MQEPWKVFKCQEVDSKAIELAVKEVLQEEPGGDLDIVGQDEIYLRLSWKLGRCATVTILRLKPELCTRR